MLKVSDTKKINFESIIGIIAKILPAGIKTMPIIAETKEKSIISGIKGKIKIFATGAIIANLLKEAIEIFITKNCDETVERNISRIPKKSRILRHKSDKTGIK